ncbi:MAG: ribosomal L7Ae/L30e/S12e/Gadd45 family protein [Clostridia bacterium]|nr:ribosomal L7Ae/L30e/S12e/Gadd45 family protein [Clostridia bacterium]
MSKANFDHEARLLSGLGLCVRAGKVIFGVPMICDAMRKGGSGMPVLVLEAADTSENTHKRITDKCVFYQVKHVRLGCSGATLATALGKTSFLAAVAVTDAGMTGLVEKYL